MLATLFGVACGSASDDQGDSSQEANNTEEGAASDNTKAEDHQQQSQGNTPSQQDLSLGDTVTFRYGDTVTVYSYTSPVQPDGELIQPKAGNQFAAIDVEGCAGSVEVTGESGNTQMGFNPFSFALQMPDNTRLQPSIPVVEPALYAANLSAGDCLRGNVSFEIPQGQTPHYVLFTGVQPEYSAILTTPQPEQSAKWAIE